MRSSLTLLLTATILLLVSPATQARVSHGYSGTFTLDTVTAVGDGTSGLPQATSLATIYPNPFNPRTTIAFDLAEAGSIELAIFDLRGRLVRVVESGSWPSGRHRSTWNGQDAEARAAPAGTYFCRLATLQGSQIKKLALVR